MTSRSNPGTAPAAGGSPRLPVASTIAALLIITFALVHSIREDTAVGSLRGTVFSADSKRMLAGARVTVALADTSSLGEDEERPRVRRAITAADGSFSLSHLPAGDYLVSAVARAHSISSVPITIAEGSATQTTISVDRSQSPLQVRLHQRIFGTAESPHLSISGYADDRKSAGSDMMQVRVFKTRLSEVLKGKESADALEKVGSSFDPAQSLPLSLVHPKNLTAPVRIAIRRVPIKDDPEGFFYQSLDFAALGLKGVGPGLYLLDVSHLGSTRCAWVLVTDTALVAKRSQNRLLGFAVDMQSGAPIQGSILRAYQGGRIVAQKTAGSDGVGVLTLPASAVSANEGGDESKQVTLVASRGNDEAVVSRSYYRNEESSGYTLHTYTDRPIYRPGQHISFKSIVRATNPLPAETQVRYTVPVGQRVDVELRDPTGELVTRQALTTNRFGSIAGGADINPEAPTGVYTLKTTVDGTEHTHDVVIASYRKPEFAVTVTPDKKRYGQGEQVRMTISAQYYFGAPVAGAKVKYDVNSSPDWSSEYASSDSEDVDTESSFEPGVGRGRHEYFGASVTSGETRLDANGKAVITFSTDNPERPRFMRAGENYTMTATVTEGENREAEGDGAALITPGEFHITATPAGYVTAPGSSATVKIEALDYDKKPVPNVPVDVELGYQTWTHGDLTFKRTGRQSIRLGPDGRGSIVVNPPRSGEFVIKLRAYDAQRRLIVGRGTMFVSDDNGGDLDTEYADLALLTDKRIYNAGDRARVLINAQRTGETVLLTIEGERLYNKQTLRMDHKSRVVYIPILREYGPNAYVSACYVRDKHMATSSASLRVSTPQHDLHVLVSPDRRATGAQTLPRYGPGEKITYHITTTDSRGRPAPAELSFGVVDESIYALKEDDPAALRDDFYPRRSNQVATEYSFAIQYLGDADKSEPKITARKKFPDTAFWNPAVTTDANGNAEVSFNLPDNLTTWRATATAHSTETRLGRTTAKVISSKDFLVRVQTPRFLTQKDQSEIVAFLHNETGRSQSATVRLTADNLTLGGPALQSVQLTPGQIGQVKWPVTASNNGRTLLTVKAWTTRDPQGNQFTDGVESTLPIRVHGREMVQGYAGQLTAARPESEVVRVDPAAVKGLNRLTVRITPSISSALLGATNYLIGYPYGCTEQTMSRFLPDLLVEHSLKQHGVLTTANTAELPRMVRNGLQRLYRFQHPESGGWGWWEHDSDNAWMTAYVIYGLSTARAEGYNVSDNVLTKARKAAEAMIANVNTDLSDRAFLVYAVALSGEHAAALAARTHAVPFKKLRADALAYMILTDRLLGRSDPTAIAELNQRAVFADGMIHWPEPATAFDWTDIGVTSLALRAIVALNPQDQRIGQALTWLMSKRDGNYWSSTRDTAMTLAGLCDYLSSQGPLSAGGEVRVKVNGQLYQTFAMTPELLREKEVALRVDPGALRTDKNDITLERVGGNSAVFYSVQFTQTVASEDLPVLANGKLQVKREYLRLVSKPTGSGYYTPQTEPSHNQLTGSDWVRVRLTIKSPRDLSYVLVEDTFPAGCEVNERGDASDVTEWGYWWSSVDVRDDKIAFFCRTLSKGEHVIEYNLRAQTPGTYHVMPSMTQAMYSPEMRAESDEARITVK